MCSAKFRMSAVVTNTMKLNMLGKHFSRQHFEKKILFFSQKIGQYFMQLVSLGDIMCIKCQILFSGKEKKNINLSSAQFAHIIHNSS